MSVPARKPGLTHGTIAITIAYLRVITHSGRNLPQKLIPVPLERVRAEILQRKEWGGAAYEEGRGWLGGRDAETAEHDGGQWAAEPARLNPGGWFGIQYDIACYSKK